MKKQAPVYTFNVRFTGKQAKAIEAVAKSKGVTSEAMVRQAVRDALDKASNKQEKQHLEDYVLTLLGNRRTVASPRGAVPVGRALERRVLTALDGSSAAARTSKAKVVNSSSAKAAKAAKPVRKTATAKKTAKKIR